MFIRITVMWKVPEHSCWHTWEQNAGSDAVSKGVFQCLKFAGNQSCGTLAALVIILGLKPGQAACEGSLCKWREIAVSLNTDFGWTAADTNGNKVSSAEPPNLYVVVYTVAKVH